MSSGVLKEKELQVNLFAEAQAGKPVTIFAVKPKTWWDRVIEKLRIFVWSLVCGAMGWILCLAWNSF